MRKITRIEPELITVITFYPNNPFADRDRLNEYEFRNLQVEVAKGLWTNCCIEYMGKYEGKVEFGTINPDGSITQPLDILNMNVDYQFELLKIKNCISV